MEYWAKYHQEYLRKYIKLENGIPSHDTLCRVFGMISPDIIQQLYSKWQELVNREEGEVLKKLICIDGKTMRSNKKKKNQAILYLHGVEKMDFVWVKKQYQKKAMSSLRYQNYSIKYK